MTTHTVPNPIRPMIYTAGLAMLTVIGLAVAKSFDVIEADLVKRAGCVAFGVLLVVLGNILPKLALPPSAFSADPTGKGSGRVMLGERLAGWIFVLAGIAYIVVWAAAPLNEGMLIASLIGLSAFALALIIWLWASSGATRRLDALANSVLSARHIMFHMLHAVFWSFAMFMAASLWGKDVVLWMAVGFALANGVLGICLTARKPRSKV